RLPPWTVTSLEPPGPSVVTTLIAPTSTGGTPDGGPEAAVPGFTVPTYVNPRPTESLHPGGGSTAWAVPERIALATRSAVRIARIGGRSLSPKATKLGVIALPAAAFTAPRRERGRSGRRRR